MSKKLFSLAPLLAIAAFAVMPAVAQAVPGHWFKNGKRQAEAVKVPVMTWGGAVNLKQESPAGEINCKGVGAGYIENPKGTGTEVGEKGPAGAGATLSSNFYECKEPKCETEVKEKLGALGYSGVGFAVTYNFPWENKILGEGPYEEKIGAKPNQGAGQSWGSQIGPETAAGTSQAYAEGWPAKFQAPSGFGGEPKGRNWGAPGAIGAVVGCEVFPNPEGNATFGGIKGQPERVGKESELPFEGELHPLIGGGLNNAPSASNPAVVEFIGTASGTLEDPLGPGLGGANTGQVKYLGYETQTPISVAP